MDIDAAVGQLGRLEHGAIPELQAALGSLQSTVGELQGLWFGDDASRFQAQWGQNHVNLTLFHSALVDLGGALSRAISDQREVSGS
jgi:uncharacterized protein YukE